MKRYESSTPRAALGLSAVTMAAITIAGLVVLPAQWDSASAEPYAVAAATSAAVENATATVPSDAPETAAHHEQVRFGCRKFDAQAHGGAVAQRIRAAEPMAEAHANLRHCAHGAADQIFIPLVQTRARCHGRTA
jgi:hypothetical protein